MRSPLVAASLSTALAAAALVWPPAARAQGGDDHATAEAMLKQLEGEAAHRTVAAEAIARARDALERATRLRSAGDETHAKAADGLAREWAEEARDVARAADAEAAAAEVRRRAVDAQAQLERTRALVEEGIARVGRLKAELEQVERASVAAGATATTKGRRAVEQHAAEPAASAAASSPTSRSSKAAAGGRP